MSKTVRSAALALTLLSSTVALAGMQARVEANDFRALRAPVRTGAKVRLHNVPLGASQRTLELERFDVWAPGAEIVVQNGDGSTSRIQPPAMNYFRGTVGGDPATMVFVAARADGAVDGMVFTEDARYTMRSTSGEEIIVDEAGPQDISADGGFTCELDGAPAVKNMSGLPKVASDAKLAAEGTLSGTGTWTLNLAIETDYELYTDLGSSSDNVAAFIGNLVGAASVIYQRDLRTELLVSYSRIQTSAADPWNVVPGGTGAWNGNPSVTYSTSHALAEVGDLWANAGTRPFNGARSSVILVSGKQQTAGVAWVGTTCGSDFACGAGCGEVFNGHTGGRYAYVGLGNQFTTSVPAPNNTVNGIQYGIPSSNYWALLGFAHELGHNVDGPHTHCFALSSADKTTYNVTRDWIDVCVTAGGCNAGATAVPAERGTIMSYCHLASGTWPTSRFLFGKSGETSELMANHIKGYINSVTPASPGITAPASVDVNTSANASITSPSGSLTYQWSITNGTINGSSTSTTVNFTATANPVTLRARATNSSGCSASDSVNVSVNTCGPPVFSSYTAGMTITLGTTIELNAVATGNGPITYQWYVGTTGNTSTPAAVGNPINATPSSTTYYWVRATNSCGLWADSPTIGIGVVTPPTTSTSLYIVTPCRVVDTRTDGGTLASAATRNISFTGTCGIPSGAKAVVANVTAVAPSAAGFLSIYPTDGIWPGNSTISYRAGKTRANNAIIVLASDGRATVLNNGAAQHFIIDVTGYFQ
ncbi:MAG TPA: M12 family metallo-peptidase [Thermoanaerobaculia bacterium]|nr:M12 family metallo-peptidase [Thermoanaerobaculia bacterium]